MNILMNEADGGEGGGGGGAAVAMMDTSLATGAEGGDGTGGEETALATTDGDGTTQGADGAALRKTEHPGLTALKTHENAEVKKFANTVIRDRAFRNELSRMFPGVNPKTAIESLQRDMVSLAGRNWNTPDPKDAARRTGIQQVRDRLAEIEEIDLMFYGGNPQLLDGMTADDEGKSAFAKLAPHMMARWRDLAPNAYSASRAREMVADLTQAQLKNDKGEVVANADVPFRIQRIALALKGDKDGNVSPLDMQLVRNELMFVQAYMYQLQQMTSLAPEVFTKTADREDSKLAERERKIAEREAQNRNADWNNARQIMANQVTTKTWNQLTKGHEISADDQEECVALFQRRFEAKIKAKEPRADENRKGYIESDDRDGYLAYENYLMTTYGVPALKEQVTRMLAKMGPSKPGAKSAATVNGQPAVVKPPAQGFTKLAEKPPLHVISNDGRTREMVLAKQAVLRIPWNGHPAGKKICW
jgi:hypothetical protein